jgi:DNA polymerase
MPPIYSPKPGLSPWQLHVKKWSNCTLCEYAKRRTKVALCRGKLPCDILFIGEAPGPSEDVFGLPFYGPAGNLLDTIIEKAIPKKYSHALTNLVACIPLSEDHEKFSEPDDECVKLCSPRLKEIANMANPQLVVCVGSCARDWLDPKRRSHIPLYSRWLSKREGKDVEIPNVHIVHPAAIIRSNVAMQGFAIQKCIVTIATAVEDYCLPF